MFGIVSINEFGKHGDSMHLFLNLFDIFLTHGVVFLDHFLLDLFLHLELAQFLDLIFIQDDAGSISQAELGLVLEILSVFSVEEAELCSHFRGVSNLVEVAVNVRELQVLEVRLRVVLKLLEFGADGVGGLDLGCFVLKVEVCDGVVSFVGLPVALVVLFHDLNQVVLRDLNILLRLSGES